MIYVERNILSWGVGAQSQNAKMLISLVSAIGAGFRREL